MRETDYRGSQLPRTRSGVPPAPAPALADLARSPLELAGVLNRDFCMTQGLVTNWK
jgi:hypothetical protein